jgi:hypothetical protein
VVNGCGEALRTLPRGSEAKADDPAAPGETPLVSASDADDPPGRESGDGAEAGRGLRIKIWTHGAVSVDALVAQLVGMFDAGGAIARWRVLVPSPCTIYDLCMAGFGNKQSIRNSQIRSRITSERGLYFWTRIYLMFLRMSIAFR